jgi:transmembrane sensor
MLERNNRMTSGGTPRSTLDEAADWHFRRDEGRFGPEDEAALEAWLAASPEHRSAYAEVRSTWDDLAGIPRPAIAASASRPHAGARPITGIFALAACVAVAIGLGAAFDLPTRIRADAYSATGETRTVRLDDGSSVELNSASAISIAYSPTRRTIRLLQGEAAFKVAKDPDRPFVVEANGGATQALGTVFVIRDFGEETTVTVLESRVAVSYPAGEAELDLSPGETVAYSSKGLGPARKVDADAETAWRRGKLIFVDRPLGSVVDELNRYHVGRIVITDPSIRNLRVSGVFATGDPIRALNGLEFSLGLRSTRLTDRFVLLGR